MSLFYPLGLLGLLSIAVLVLIYIIKPNFQQKRVSSTYIWKLSLKYRKKKIPVSKLRNILIIICQVLTLITCAVILSQPNQKLRAQIDRPEIVAVVDCSASMLTISNGESRFQKAIGDLITDINNFSNDGVVTVILANDNPYVFRGNVESQGKGQLVSDLQALDDSFCSFTTADIETALSLGEISLKSNPSANIYLYTDSNYAYHSERVKIIDAKRSGEWNAAVLNAYSRYEENFYTFYVEIATYGRNAEVDINLSVHGVNGITDPADAKYKVSFSERVACSSGTTKTVIFKYFVGESQPPLLDESSNIIYYDDLKVAGPGIGADDAVISYTNARVEITNDDNFLYDNQFEIYGGQREKIRIQYATTKSNPFFAGILYALENIYDDLWDIDVDEVQTSAGEAYATEDYDFYIFEHFTPSIIPTDGVIFLVNPDTHSAGLGLEVNSPSNFTGQAYNLERHSHPSKYAPLLNEMVPEKITVTQYTNISVDVDYYSTLISLNGAPMLIARSDESVKVAIMPFSLHFSNLAISDQFPLLMMNMFEFFLPSTVKGNAFEVSQSVALNARGPELTVSWSEGSQKVEKSFTTFPSTLKVSTPGQYSLTQTLPSQREVTEYIFVKIPALESNIIKTKESVTVPTYNPNVEDYFKDLLIFIASTLVAVLFIEWLLHIREEA